MINYFYNILLKDDECDLYSDVLTSIRKDYYLSREKQKGKITQDSSADTLFYEFSLEKDKALKWQLSDSENILSDTSSLEDGKYCVNFYNEYGVCKVLTFSKFHTLLKVEYFDMSVSAVAYCTIEPRKANNELCLLMSRKSTFGSVVLYAMPFVDDEYINDKINNEFTDYSVTASTNAGVVKFLSEEQLELFNDFVDKAIALKASQEAPQSFIEEDDAVLAQKLNPKDFNVKRNLSQAVDLNMAQVFTYDICEQYIDDEDVEENENIAFVETDDNAFDAPVELDVDKTLEDFLSACEQPQVYVEQPEDADYSCEVEEIKEAESDAPCVVADVIYEDDFSDEISDSDFEVCDTKSEPDLVIENSNAKYLYFGQLDESGKRCGFGRTTTENGHTAYEGNYSDNKRNGIGSYYYKDGMLCYFGEWKDNKRDGVGVGVSSFDKSIHVGKFSDNKPVSDGVRIDGNGEIKFIKKMLSNGLTVVLEFDGDKILIKKYDKNGELISENSSNLMYF